MTVELAPVTRKDMIDTITVVGNLVGAATVDAVPRGQGRLDAVYVKLGDPVRRGQAIAKIEDREIVEQIKQAEATLNVSQATIRQRQADLKLAQNNMERSKSLFERDLLPRQTFDDTDARYQAAQAQLELVDGAAGADPIAARRAEDQPAEHRSSRRLSKGSSASARSIRARASARTRRSCRSSTSGPFASSSTSSRKTCGGFIRARRSKSKSTRIPERTSWAAWRASRRFSIRPRVPRRWKSKFRTALIA